MERDQDSALHSLPYLAPDPILLQRDTAMHILISALRHALLTLGAALTIFSGIASATPAALPVQTPAEGADNEPAPAPGLIEPLVRPDLDSARAPQPASPVASSALGKSILPDGWVLAGAIAAVVAALAGALIVLMRRRKTPTTLRLAAPASPSVSVAAPPPASTLSKHGPIRLDLQLDIVSATRSVMMFSLEYRLELANRSDRGANDVTIALHLDCARHGAANAPSAGAAQDVQILERIGAQQSRTITGTLRLPVAELAILKRGATPMFVPLVHAIIENEHIASFTRSYVIGTPSTTSITRVHPLVLDTQPGSIAGLRAQMIEIPAQGDGQNASSLGGSRSAR